MKYDIENIIAIVKNCKSNNEIDMVKEYINSEIEEDCMIYSIFERVIINNLIEKQLKTLKNEI